MRPTVPGYTAKSAFYSENTSDALQKVDLGVAAHRPKRTPTSEGLRLSHAYRSGACVRSTMSIAIWISGTLEF